MTKKSILSAVCKLANEFVKEGWDQSRAMRQGWLCQKTTNSLHKGLTHFFYMKKSGEYREAFGHMNLDMLPKEISIKGTRAPHKGNQTYWDVEQNGWREFKKCFLVKLCED